MGPVPQQVSPTIDRAPTATADRSPRRLTRDARHKQLVAAATPVLAAQGFSDFSLDEIAAKADVSRNLLYHYFPRGRLDVVLAVAEQAGHQLTDDWLVDESIPVAERLAVNNSRMIEHAMKPTEAWTIYQHAQGSSDPEVKEKIDRFVEVVITAMSVNHLGNDDPPPLYRLAIKGYLAFFGSVLDESRTEETPTEDLLKLLGETLFAALRAAE